MLSWWTTCLVAWKSIVKVTNQKVTRWPKRFFFFFFFFFRHASSKLWLFHDFCTKQQHFTPSSAPADCFSFNFVVSQGGLNQSLKNYGFIRDAIFTCTHVHQSLSNETIIIQDIAELEKFLCAWRQGESLSSIVDSVFEQSLVNDSSANTAEEAYEDRLAALWQMPNFSSSCC